LSWPEFGVAADEVAVEVEEGDAVLLDARLLHATYDNASDDGRSALLMWWTPDFAQLPAPLRAIYGDVAVPESWPDELRRALSAQGTYKTPGEPSPQLLNPDQRLV
jgi:ectoine hydroxylase-related dioxygenase (phytanoyl-CoA dioxygenase family)